jgi:hypothetical protein
VSVRPIGYGRIVLFCRSGAGTKEELLAAFCSIVQIDARQIRVILCNCTVIIQDTAEVRSIRRSTRRSAYRQARARGGGPVAYEKQQMDKVAFVGGVCAFARCTGRLQHAGRRRTRAIWIPGGDAPLRPAPVSPHHPGADIVRNDDRHSIGGLYRHPARGTAGPGIPRRDTPGGARWTAGSITRWRS